MDKDFSEMFRDKGYYPSEFNEIIRIDNLLLALKCQNEIYENDEHVEGEELWD